MTTRQPDLEGRTPLAQRVMVAFDASPPAQEAAQYAVALARCLGAGALFGSVLDVTTTGAEPQPLIEDAALAEEVQESLNKLVQEAAEQGVEARSVLRYGQVVPTLLQIAEAEGVDLIVCGTHGRRGLRRLVLGSVAEALARQASCPVLLVRQGGDAAQNA